MRATVVALLALLVFAATASADSLTNQFKTRCLLAASGAFDPIVHPGEPTAGHEHRFFGNPAINSSSTPASLRAASAHSSCLDRFDTADYWVPALYKNGVEVRPLFTTVYYPRMGGLRHADGTVFPTTESFPDDWQIVAGNSAATGPQKAAVVDWSCAGGTLDHGPVPVDCTATDLTGAVFFPNCTNLRKLPNGQYDAKPMTVLNGVRSCPAGYDHQVPRLELAIHYGPQPADCRVDPSTGCVTYTLSTGPTNPASIYQWHADFMNGWQTGAADPQDDLDSLVARCSNAPDGMLPADCGLIITDPPGDLS